LKLYIHIYIIRKYYKDFSNILSKSQIERMAEADQQETVRELQVYLYIYFRNFNTISEPLFQIYKFSMILFKFHLFLNNFIKTIKILTFYYYYYYYYIIIIIIIIIFSCNVSYLLFLISYYIYTYIHTYMIGILL